jgi:hypothetical protein
LTQLDLIMAWGGALICACGGLLLLYRLWFVLSGGRAEGEIIGHTEHDYGGAAGEIPISTTVYAAKVSFRDNKGQCYKFESRIHSRSRRHFIGERIRIIYRPDNPEYAFIAEPFENLALPGFLLVFGAYPIWRYLPMISD